MCILSVMIVVILLVSSFLCDAMFDDKLVVPVPQTWHGPRGMMGDIIELKDGTLLLSYSVHAWWAEGRLQGIYARTSSDHGQTWSKEYLLLSNPGQGYYAHPSFLRLPNDDILMSYIYDISINNTTYGHTYYKRSTDEGKTWSDQFIVTPISERTLVHNDKLLLLSTGRILAPAEYSPSAPGTHRGYVSTSFYSDTNGYSWQMSKNIVKASYEVQEPHLVELKDGRIMMMFRTYSGFCGRAFSDDGGETWSEPQPLKDLKMSTNASAITIDRIPSTGDLLLLRCTGSGEEGRTRTPFVSAISKDEGKTWILERVIAGEPKGDYGYQAERR